MTDQTGAPCKVCGAHALRPKEHHLTQKRRPKFGLLWIIVTICTAGIGLLAYLVWPRHKVTVSVDRWLECTACGARQT
jgi:NhaP-type Na+/H+ or K+/H+ antiporter